jgi:hypothetical protein
MCLCDHLKDNSPNIYPKKKLFLMNVAEENNANTFRTIHFLRESYSFRGNWENRSEGDAIISYADIS